MHTWKRFLILFVVSLLALVLFVCSIAGTPENPNDLSDTSGVPAAYMFATFIMAFGVFSWGVSLVGLLVRRLVSDERANFKKFIIFISSLPLFLTSAFGAFSVAVFSYDSIIGLLGGILFFSVMACLCLTSLPVSKIKRAQV
ncbi:hypothetical protein POF45_28795 [Pseudomonas sp. 681]|uniref:Uncharacterized protein n=1 Tax=Pseudomonas fungipugnans TaxID=3024217 RepID=A0ABT6QWV7_9PSED|nr:hypothetical protein [Pseudomonas sp. 681]MDI2595391.1 hypothetical protein [Pseudomonas sp. 681]